MTFDPDLKFRQATTGILVFNVYHFHGCLHLHPPLADFRGEVVWCPRGGSGQLLSTSQSSGDAEITHLHQILARQENILSLQI